jgi:two-component system NtrC family sensor kinase
MKKIISVCILFISIVSVSQTFPKKYVDSLTSVALSKKSSHPLKLNRQNALQQLWRASIPADRIAIFYDIVAYSDQITPEQSQYYHKLILDGAQKRNDKILEAAVMAESGYITSQNGNTAEGLKMLYKSLELAETTGNAQAIGIAYNNLGNCYPNNLQMQRDYMTKALEYSRKGNDHMFTCFNLSNLGKMLLKENKKEAALLLFLESYRLAVEKNSEPNIPSLLLSLSTFDKKENRLQYFHQAYQMPFAIRNTEAKNRIDNRKALYYLQEKKMDSAFYFTNESYKYTKTADLTTQMNGLALMGQYYRALKNSDSILSYTERFYTLKDSLYGNKVIEEAQNMAYNDMQRQKELAAQNAALKNKLILYFLSAIVLFLVGLAFIFWRSKRKEQQAKKLLQLQKDQLEQTLDKLKSTQSQLIQSEKMASLGELTAGIAHEIQNPLNFVNNFSEVSNELLDEMNEELDKGDIEEAKAISADIKQNLEKINHHGKRADAIVKGMLQHSRSTNNAVKEPTDINKLTDEYLRLAYHGLRAKDKSFNATMKTEFDATIGDINIIPQDIGRVILNLITNAFYATNEKQALRHPEASGQGDNYEPTVTVSTKKVGDKVEISVKDNGNGIPQKVIDKIFQPFFTTKPTGQGTGLGLSLSYDIVKAHGGELKVETKENEGTKFSIQLPV